MINNDIDKELREEVIKDPEHWKNLDFLGFPNNYVSFYGDVITTNRRGTHKYDFLTVVYDKDDYCTVNLNYRGRKQNRKVHQLVALAFIDNPNNLPQVNHMYDNKHDNFAEHLEWINNLDNCNHYQRILNAEKYERRKQRAQDMITDYGHKLTITEIAKKYKLSLTYVYHICVKGDASIVQ